MKIFSLKDCYEPECTMGLLICGNDEITANIMQEGLANARYQAETVGGIDDWDCSDVVERLPKEWNTILIFDNGEVFL